ncbi:uncharacterized protein LOC135497915 isoform X2 [Lineus longissimus]|uniref:uncharacterized protein LOC135497915 isoform X2 n=1 Tax=Lineus longissimus TaxID=88925 RepID=UPI00315D5411
MAGLNEGLESGSNWTDQDLNKFGIQYHITVTEPSGIFEKVKPYTIGTRISLNDLAVQKLTEYTTMLQENFNDAFVLDVNSFELIEMIDACNMCNEMRGTCRGSGDLKTKYAASEIEAKWKEIHKNVRLNIAGAKSQLLTARLKAVSKSWDPTFVMIDTFLTKVNKVLRKASPSNLEVNEGTFVDLFQHFARIFLVEFIPAMVKRSLMMGGMEVTSINDLRYDYEDHESYDRCEDAPTIVVTVAEVKKGAKRKKLHCRKRKQRISKVQRTEGRDNVGGANAAAAADDDEYDDDIDNDEDGDTGDRNPSDIIDDDRVEFSSRLRGQLGIELLADIDRSCLKEVNNKRMILGLTVEATWELCSDCTLVLQLLLRNN